MDQEGLATKLWEDNFSPSTPHNIPDNNSGHAGLRPFLSKRYISPHRGEGLATVYTNPGNKATRFGKA
jgi:hypothetical protein